MSRYARAALIVLSIVVGLLLTLHVFVAPHWMASLAHSHPRRNDRRSATRLARVAGDAARVDRDRGLARPRHRRQHDGLLLAADGPLEAAARRRRRRRAADHRDADRPGRLRRHLLAAVPRFAAAQPLVRLAAGVASDAADGRRRAESRTRRGAVRLGQLLRGAGASSRRRTPAGARGCRRAGTTAGRGHLVRLLADALRRGAHRRRLDDPRERTGAGDRRRGSAALPGHDAGAGLRPVDSGDDGQHTDRGLARARRSIAGRLCGPGTPARRHRAGRGQAPSSMPPRASWPAPIPRPTAGSAASCTPSTIRRAARSG